MKTLVKNLHTQEYEEVDLGQFTGTLFVKNIMVSDIHQDSVSIEMTPEIADKLIEEIQKAKNSMSKKATWYAFRITLSGNMGRYN